MNIPKTISEAVFLAVCNCAGGKGIEEPWDFESHKLDSFNAKGQLIRKGHVELEMPGGMKLEVPFNATFTFGKPRRAKVEAAAKKVSQS